MDTLWPAAVARTNLYVPCRAPARPSFQVLILRRATIETILLRRYADPLAL